MRYRTVEKVNLQLNDCSFLYRTKNDISFKVKRFFLTKIHLQLNEQKFKCQRDLIDPRFLIAYSLKF